MSGPGIGIPIGPERIAPGPFDFCRLTLAGRGNNKATLQQAIGPAGD